MKEVVLTGILSIFLLVACTTDADREKAYNSVVSTTQFEDTLVYYHLYSDSLVIEFDQPPKIKDWHGEIFITHKDESKTIHIEFPGKTYGHVGKVHFSSKKKTFKGFHIPEDSLSQYRVLFRAIPHFRNYTSIGEVNTPMYLFVPDDQHPNQFMVEPNVEDYQITLINLRKLKYMPEDMRVYCWDLIEHKYGITITWEEIDACKNLD